MQVQWKYESHKNVFENQTTTATYFYKEWESNALVVRATPYKRFSRFSSLFYAR